MFYSSYTQKHIRVLWWKFIVRFEIMTFSDRSCLWVYLMVISAEVTQHHGAQKGTGRKNLYKEAFHKTWYMRKIRYERGGEILPWICVRKSAAPGRKQIRAYILLIKVIAVRHQQIRVAFCQIDSITAVRHLVRGCPQSRTKVSIFFQQDLFRLRYSSCLDMTEVQ